VMFSKTTSVALLPFGLWMWNRLKSFAQLRLRETTMLVNAVQLSRTLRQWGQTIVSPKQVLRVGLEVAAISLLGHTMKLTLLLIKCHSAIAVRLRLLLWTTKLLVSSVPAMCPFCQPTVFALPTQRMGR